ncbi:hypothetical protein A2625_01090 [candidate division WOR-1 bacterium RIFCSPHIGHO2_01_FULL_53_15]|uniref:Uncharacterized protein n=1 Tax=candidate division WOR-1 bacterium RIFCSPHIGHO2_01_FULL_53_15 TaxID=1802564 RepID=A0A1F4Q0W1_UNCSA|nr:MAG: hypothetical protein A2625_01090 [candidate division WOR-1 bacterium RIFCSPHIGHO2_01_FULL_53_15]OGC10743.1 MAG: hypothetical protein A3D23_04600 [candidate division WOR-1 bacterium RIFCSPHIGHO2_02_FULL_53_26]
MRARTVTNITTVLGTRPEVVKLSPVKTARAIALSMIEKMQMNDGAFHATYNVNLNKPVDETRVWSRHPGSHHAKLAIGFLALYGATRDQRLGHDVRNPGARSL